MFLDKFEDGKRYRFNKELLSKYIELKGYADTSGWEDDIHLEEVTILSGRDACIGRYAISPEWCEEIVTEPLKTRDDIKYWFEQALQLEELEKILDVIKYDNENNGLGRVGDIRISIEWDDFYITDERLKDNFKKFIKFEIERIKQELGLEE